MPSPESSRRGSAEGAPSTVTLPLCDRETLFHSCSPSSLACLQAETKPMASKN